MWVDAVDDEKLKLLAFEDRWHFVAILCCKRKGILDAPDESAMRDRKVGAKLGLADRDRDEVRRRLMEVGLINVDWQPLAWGKRQFTSDADPTASKRKQKQRERERHGRVTRDNRDSHAPVTDESLEGHAPQTQITDSDTEKKPSLRSGRAPARAPARRVPADFEVNAEMRKWATEACPHVDIDRQTEAFRDHEFRNAHKDWPAVWRQWMRRVPEFQRGPVRAPAEEPKLTWRPPPDEDDAPKRL
jgi:hypothetical protein